MGSHQEKLRDNGCAALKLSSDPELFQRCAECEIMDDAADELDRVLTENINLKNNDDLSRRGIQILSDEIESLKSKHRGYARIFTAMGALMSATEHLLDNNPDDGKVGATVLRRVFNRASEVVCEELGP